MPEGSMNFPAPRRRDLVWYYAYSYIPLQTLPKATGAFNRVFPVQTALYDHPQESMFDNFAKSFNPQVYELKQEAIGFCRILIQSARRAAEDKPKWLAYQD